MKASWWNAFALVHLSWVIGFHPSPGNMNHPDCPLQTRGVEALKRPRGPGGVGLTGFLHPPSTPPPRVPEDTPPGAHRIEGWGHPPRDVPPSRGVFVDAWSDPRPPAAGLAVPGPPYEGSGGPPHPPGRRERGVTKKPTAPPGACSGWGQSPPSDNRQTNREARRDPCRRLRERDHRARHLTPERLEDALEERPRAEPGRLNS